jgi:uncharacterized membrane protein
VGIYKTIDSLETNCLGSSALLLFIRDCRESGLLQRTQGEKASMTKISVHPDVLNDLNAVLAWRDNEILARLEQTSDRRLASK